MGELKLLSLLMEHFDLTDAILGVFLWKYWQFQKEIQIWKATNCERNKNRDSKIKGLEDKVYD